MAELTDEDREALLTILPRYERTGGWTGCPRRRLVAAIVDRHVAAALESVAVAVEEARTNHAEGDALVQCRRGSARAGCSARRRRSVIRTHIPTPAAVRDH